MSASPDPDGLFGSRLRLCLPADGRGGRGGSLSPCPLVSDSYCSWAAHKSAGHGMLAKRGIWVKGWRALSFGPPHARWHLKVSQAVKSSPSLSLALPHSLPFSPLPAAPDSAPVLSPRVFPAPTLSSLIIPPIFSSHPWTRSTSLLLIILPLHFSQQIPLLFWR